MTRAVIDLGDRNRRQARHRDQQRDRLDRPTAMMHRRDLRNAAGRMLLTSEGNNLPIVDGSYWPAIRVAEGIVDLALFVREHNRRVDLLAAASRTGPATSSTTRPAPSSPRRDQPHHPTADSCRTCSVPTRSSLSGL